MVSPQPLGGGATAIRADVLNRAGTLAAEQGDYPAARTHFEAARTLGDALGDQEGVARAEGNLGSLALYAGDPAEAARRYTAAADYMRDAGIEWGHGLPESLETLAGVAEPETGARFLGAAEVARAAAGTMRPPDEEGWVADVTAALRTALGEPAFAAAVAAGRGLDFDAAIALGLATARPAPR
jgi:tetratricopeptide (TPR) repeat protein